MREPRILIVLVLAAALLFAVSAAAQVIVLTRATVVDGTGAGPQKDFTIITSAVRYPVESTKTTACSIVGEAQSGLEPAEVCSD